MEDNDDRDSIAVPEENGPDSVPPEGAATDSAAPQDSDESPVEPAVDPVTPVAESAEPDEGAEDDGEDTEDGAEDVEESIDVEAPDVEADEATDDSPVGEPADEEPPAEEAIPRVDAVEASGIDDTPSAAVAKGRVPWWPFLVYLVAWIGVIGAAFYLISYGPDALPAFQQDDYPYILLAGLVLTVLGPLLSFLVWFVTRWRTPKGERGGLLTAALLKGALVTCFGVLAWWGAIVVLDALRLGLIGPLS